MSKYPEGHFMTTVRVGDKGQIVIPKEVREMFGISPGDTLLLLAAKHRGIALPPPEECEKIQNEIFGRHGI
ncbi:MAG: AbrB/MazE/SpoVT family DNA-binding domain-containing protein [Clostridia bacterium]|nr:AbrB/MazE/SpoVT family DNA-binding domain-containing protein [Clostridia bacterium]